MAGEELYRTVSTKSRVTRAQFTSRASTINAVERLQSRGDAINIFGGNLCSPPRCTIGHAGDMRSGNDIWKTKDRRTHVGRFLAENIQPGSADSSCEKHLLQCGLVHECTTRHIDQESRGLPQTQPADVAVAKRRDHVFAPRFEQGWPARLWQVENGQPLSHRCSSILLQGADCFSPGWKPR